MASWWDAIVVFFTGKDVAILGPRSAGKTTLYDFLQYRTVVSKPGSTDGHGGDRVIRLAEG